MREILFRGKRLDDKKWVEGFAYEHQPPLVAIVPKDYVPEKSKWYICKTAFADWNMPRQVEFIEVDPATVGQYTGLKDKNGKLIYEGDITELILPGGEIRRFEVAIKTVIREVVSHPDFDSPTAKVAITGAVFLWNGYELFPCVGDDGVVDTSRMTVVGNIHDSPELLREENQCQDT